MRDVNNRIVALSLGEKSFLHIFYSSKQVFLIWRSYIIIIFAYPDFDASIFKRF